RIRTELPAALDGEWRNVAPLQKDAPGGGTTRRGLPLTRVGRGGRVELGWRGAVAGAGGDQRCSGGLTHGDAVVFGLAVRDRGERARPCCVEARRTARQIVLEHAGHGRNGSASADAPGGALIVPRY